MKFLFLLILFLAQVLHSNSAFTDEELTYLDQKKQITMCIDPDWIPFEAIKDSKHIGMTAEHFKLFEEKIGIPIVMVPTKTWSESIAFAKERKCDIFSLAMETKERKEYMNFTKAYLEAPLVITTRMNTLFISNAEEVIQKPLGITKGYAYIEILKDKYPSINLVEFETLGIGLKAVRDGKVFGYIDNLITSGYAIQNDYYAELKIAGKFNDKWSLGIGVRNDDLLLLQIFEKAIKLVEDEKYSHIINKWVNVRYEKGFDYSLFLKILLFFAVAASMFIYRHITLKRYTNELNAQKHMYDLVFKNSDSSVCILDKETNKFTDCNEPAIELFKCDSKEEVLNLHPSDFSPEFQADGRRSAEKANVMIELAYKKGSHTFEWIHMTKTNKEFWVEVSLTPIILNNKKVLHAVMKNIDDRKEAEKKLLEQRNILNHQAHHDSLTGLPNRTLFNDRLYQAIEKAKRHRNKLAVFFIDLDRFKQINDSLGHVIGDRVLKEVSLRLSNVIRKEDSLARLGGDEFTIIMEDIFKGQDASYLAQKILNILAEPIYIDEHTLYVSSSIGISLYPQDDTDIDKLLMYADTAMYKAKDEGKNNFQFYSSEMTALAFEHVVMEANLRQALENKEFVVYYQPQVDAKKNELIGMEALVRWNHPSMGLVSPAKFIPIAEETGLIIAIDQLVMKTAMKQIVAWYEKGLNPGVLALNLAIKQLQQKEFINILKDMFEVTSFKAQWLELEITEGQIMSRPEDAISILESISELGVELAIDDFGTGYSSLSYLKRLPIDKLKIDQSFIRDLPDDEEDIAISRAVIALSKSLNLKVIAEGVETKGQKEFLVKNGCDNIQGYLYARPMPADDMEVLLSKGFDEISLKEVL